MTWFVAPVWVWLLWSVLAASSWSTPGPTEECSVMSVRLRAFRLKLSCNVTTLNEKQLKEIQAPTTMLYLPALYLLALALGPPANLLALWILAFRAKRLPSTALLLNLTAVDSLLLLALPFRIAYHFRRKPLGPGRGLLPNGHGHLLRQHVRLGAVPGAGGPGPLRGLGAPVWRQDPAHQADVPANDGCGGGGHVALADVAADVHAGPAPDHHLPRRAAPAGAGELLPALLCHPLHAGLLAALRRHRVLPLRRAARPAGPGRALPPRRAGHRVGAAVFVVCVLPSNVLLLLTYAADGEDVYVPYMLSLAVSTFSSCVDPFIFYYVSADFRDKAERALCCQGDRPPPAQPSNKVSSSRAKVALLSVSTQKELC